MTFLPAGTPGLLLAATEVKRADFAAFVQQTGHQSSGPVHFPQDGEWTTLDGSWASPPGGPPQTDEHAVVAVTPADAAAFCAWLTAQHRASGEITSGQRYRLPTAEEWARAARLPLRLGSGRQNPAVAPAAGGLTAQAPPDAAGFHDLHGSVVDWTSSPGPDEGHFLACGTGWADAAALSGEAIARPYHQDLRGSVLGFRIALETAP